MNRRICPLIMLVAMFATAPLPAAEPQPIASGGDTEARSLAAIQRDVQAALRAEALSRRQGPNVPEVTRLIELYLEMAAHPQHDTSAYLADMGLSIRSRLKDVSERIEQKTAAAKRLAKKAAAPTKQAAPANVAPESPVLAQQIGAGGGAGFGGAQAGPGGRPRGAPAIIPVDYGPELVEIIQAVISPGTWNINGGRSSIVYFAHSQALVVSAPDEIHPQIANLLQQLRAAQ